MSRLPVQFIVKLLGLCGAVLLVVCVSGCASHRMTAAWQIGQTVGESPSFAAAEQAVRGAFPPAYRATQRAIITVRQRQFVCDGLLTVSPAEGWHLALVSTLGLVTDVRVRSDGSSEVMKVTPLFREDWARDYVARELRWLFRPPTELVPAGCLSDGRLMLESSGGAEGCTARYLCSANGSRWEELEVLSGARRMMHAKVSGYRDVAGWPHAVPMEMDVTTDTHELHVRMAALSLADAAPPEGGR
jgi:hypothetical protein